MSDRNLSNSAGDDLPAFSTAFTAGEVLQRIRRFDAGDRAATWALLAAPWELHVATNQLGTYLRLIYEDGSALNVPLHLPAVTEGDL